MFHCLCVSPGHAGNTSLPPCSTHVGYNHSPRGTITKVLKVLQRIKNQAWEEINIDCLELLPIHWTREMKLLKQNSLRTSLIKHKGFEKYLRALRKNCRDVLSSELSPWVGRHLRSNFPSTEIKILSLNAGQAGWQFWISLTCRQSVSF